MATASTVVSSSPAHPVSHRRRPRVLAFCQITPEIIKYLSAKGYLNADGTPNGSTDLCVSAPAFNIRLAEKYLEVKAFLDAVAVAGSCYNMPAYGDAMMVLADHPLARLSLMPYSLAIDDFVVNKAGPAWDTLKRWMQTVVDSNGDLAANAALVMSNGDKFVLPALLHVKDSPNLTRPDWLDYLAKNLGPDWQAVSENMNSSKFLRLFGASDELLAQFVVAIGNNARGEPVQILNEARWVANFMNLFKPTTEFKKGAVSDILNFAAMCSPLNFDGRKLTDADSVAALRSFPKHTDDPAFHDIVEAVFDMEPDDVSVMTFVKLWCSGAQVTRVYPTEKIAAAAEKFLAARCASIKLSLDPTHVLIDSKLENGKILESIYF